MRSNKGRESATYEELFAAHRSQARGIFRLIKENRWQREPVTDRIHQLGNYVLLTSFITPDRSDEDYTRSRIHREKCVFVEGMVDVGFSPMAATTNADITYGTNIRDLVYPLFHIPQGSPELVETFRNGRLKSCSLDEMELCVQALIFGSAAREDG